jgi:co-chaperonin GroES (HSP10)
MLIPLRDNVLIAALEDPSTWYGSSLIVRPESTKDRADQGIVKAVGPEVRDLRVGDYVTFPPYGGTVINDADEGFKLIMVREETCKTIVTPANTETDLYVKTEDGFVPCTAEAALLVVREAYQKLPRVIEQKEKFEQRLRDLL